MAITVTMWRPSRGYTLPKIAGIPSYLGLVESEISSDQNPELLSDPNFPVRQYLMNQCSIVAPWLWQPYWLGISNLTGPFISHRKKQRKCRYNNVVNPKGQKTNHLRNCHFYGWYNPSPTGGCMIGYTFIPGFECEILHFGGRIRAQSQILWKPRIRRRSYNTPIICI